MLEFLDIGKIKRRYKVCTMIITEKRYLYIVNMYNKNTKSINYTILQGMDIIINDNST